MRVRPRTSWGKGLALAAIVLIAFDVMTVFGTLEWTPVHRVSLTAGSVMLGVTDPRPRYDGPRWSDAEERVWWMQQWTWGNSNFQTGRDLFIPLWHLWAPAIVGAGLIERGHARRGRAPLACKACRYDLAGLPPEAVCPECGQTRA